ncbi:MAG TPA: hypothetical protein PKV41_06735, partial [Candidatus Omnitrophota bacterium]|nr:hypothetical protein [Candidatus Omnitrophota bacterium]
LKSVLKGRHTFRQQVITNRIDIDAVCDDLLAKGVTAFKDAFQELFASIERKASVLAAVNS